MQSADMQFLGDDENDDDEDRAGAPGCLIISLAGMAFVWYLIVRAAVAFFGGY